ncbi:MAG TPA: (2Fe-2S)-binding protein [Pseudomonas sp.]|nr:(2Fe-2S)-binding protein [Pseudomonas sp.]
MPLITYVQPDGKTVDVEVPLGSSVMQGAVDNMVEGIVAECGGACSCATCHVYVDPAWMDIVEPACDFELDMLAAANDVRSNSRLSCQIEITPELSGLIITMPQA